MSVLGISRKNNYILAVDTYFMALYHTSFRYTTFLNYIPNTCLYNFDPIKPHFYIVKLGFTWVYIIFLILIKNIDSGYSLEPPRRGGSNEYPQSMFEQKYEKYQFFI